MEKLQPSTALIVVVILSAFNRDANPDSNCRGVGFSREFIEIVIFWAVIFKRKFAFESILLSGKAVLLQIKPYVEHRKYCPRLKLTPLSKVEIRSIRVLGISPREVFSLSNYLTTIYSSSRTGQLAPDPQLPDLFLRRVHVERSCLFNPLSRRRWITTIVISPTPLPRSGISEEALSWGSSSWCNIEEGKKSLNPLWTN